MKVHLKSKATLIAFGIAGLVLTSIAPASAGRVVRDHRDAWLFVIIAITHL